MANSNKDTASHKILLTIKEASELTGIGINKLREISDYEKCDFVLFVGNKRMFKREKLITFLENTYSI